MSFEKLNIDLKDEEKERKLFCKIIINAFNDLKCDLRLNKTSKGFSLVERGRFRGDSIRFFNSKYFKLYCELLDLPYQQYRSKIENLVKSSNIDFKTFLKNKKELINN
ncbi:MAG: hypothetical protein BV456_00935 [Thermoplasmata archaeon M8B2D]|nr:MAG: hypothetical protein BV456_00935 [Thermoplasmata archaeon M8B2D]